MDAIRSILLLSLVHLATSYPYYPYYQTYNQPNIIFVVADDLGWNDVGFRNPDMWTPNIDNAAYNGIILNRSYVQDVCTPSRAAFLTGYYPFRTGMQVNVIPLYGPFGLPLQFKLLPEVLKELGYSTHMVGKWHLGSCNPKYFPTSRGFNSFFGYLGGGQHFSSHSCPLTDDTRAISAPGLLEVYDFWNETTASTQYNGTYSSIPFMTQVHTVLANHKPNAPLFLYLPYQTVHAPIEVLEDNLQWYPNIKNRFRKGFSALTTQLDTDFGQLIKALKDYGVYKNSIIIFTTDNGGEEQSGGNNYPLRGGKFTLYEGASRATAFVHSPLYNWRGYTHNELIHAVDWCPTIIAMAGGTPDPNMDGVNVWPSIEHNLQSPRTGFVYNLQDTGDGRLRGAIRDGKWKLIFGDSGLPNTQIRPENVTGQLFAACGGAFSADANAPPFQLYNIDVDPTESNNLANSNPSTVTRLNQKVQDYKKQMVRALFLPNDVPRYRNVTKNLNILNTNWCTPTSTVTLMNSG